MRKALRLLESFSREVRSQGVTEVARKLNIHKSTAHALLTTLKEEGYVIFDPMSRKYFLGYKLIDLAGQLAGSSGDGPGDVAQPAASGRHTGAAGASPRYRGGVAVAGHLPTGLLSGEVERGRVTVKRLPWPNSVSTVITP